MRTGPVGAASFGAAALNMNGALSESARFGAARRYRRTESLPWLMLRCVGADGVLRADRARWPGGEGAMACAMLKITAKTGPPRRSYGAIDWLIPNRRVDAKLLIKNDFGLPRFRDHAPKGQLRACQGL